MLWGVSPDRRTSTESPPAEPRRPPTLHRLSTGWWGGARGPVSRILSLPRREGGGHFSGTGLAPGLERPTRKEDCAGRRAPSLFGLSPGGVCRAGSVTGSAVRSCRTVSPLPARLRPKARPDVGGLFSVALSLASRPVVVDNHPDLWSPDFPPRPLPFESARSGRPDLSRRDHPTPSSLLAHACARANLTARMSASEPFVTYLELRESTAGGEAGAGLSHTSSGLVLLHVLELAAHGEPRGAVTVVHDAGEHGGRYLALARSLARPASRDRGSCLLRRQGALRDERHRDLRAPR